MPPPEEKLESNQRWLKRLARRITRTPAQAEDLVQETYLTALTKPPPDGPMKPWLHGVMRRLAVREIRGGLRRARREESFHLAGPSVVEPDPLLDYGIDRARLRSLVESLPEPFRSTVEQRFLHGLSCVEIAHAAGVPAGTIRWRQSRALELLRSEIERPPRRRRLAWLPLLGLEPIAAVGRRVAGLSRSRSGLVLTALAIVVALVALVGRDVPAGQTPGVEAGRRRVPIRALGPVDELGLEPGAEDDPTLASASTRAVDGEEIVGRSRTRRGAGARSRRAGGSWTAMDPRRRDLYDCTDEGGQLHCVQREATVDQVGGPVCVILDRSLDALERARARKPLGPDQEAAFLRAARMANLFLASELGCGLAHEAEREKKRTGVDTDDEKQAPEVPVPHEPTCETEEDESGRSCTTCTDQNGVATTVCAPVECESSTGSDGEPCTTCTDADGTVESDCREEPDGCQPLPREVDAFASEIMPILTGEIDLNESGEAAIIGCTRGPCHALPRPGGLHLDPSDTIENNLARFSCFVDLATPELSQIFLCPSGDERCVTFPHPGSQTFTPPDDLNYQRILAYLRANAP